MPTLTIKQIRLGEGADAPVYDINAKYIQSSDGTAMTFEDITSLISAGVQLVIDTAGSDGKPATAASAQTMGKIYLVKGDGALSGSYIEFITIKDGSAYNWERIGTTETDLKNYVKNGYRITIAASGKERMESIKEYIDREGIHGDITGRE